MKLYKRPLKGLADLKREKVLLRYMRDEHTTDDLFSTESFRRKKVRKKDLGGSDSPASGLLSMAMGLLGGNSSPQALLQGGSPLLGLIGKALPKKKIAGFAWEILSGYLKWRAVEAGIWGIKQVVKARKERKRFSREAALHHPIHQHHRKPAKKKKFGLF